MNQTEQLQVRRLRIWLAAFIGLLVAALVVLSIASPAGRPILKITGVDPVAYFGTARSMLFDGNFDLSNEYASMHPLRNQWNANVAATGKPGSPFPVGFSVLQLPFLAMAAVVEQVIDGKASGYSPFAVFAWFFGILIYLGIGMQCTFTLLRLVGSRFCDQASEVNRSAFLITLLLWPSTTLGFYSLSPMAHVTAFAATAFMLLAWWHAKDTTNSTPWLWFGLAAGIMTLCRWQDGLLLIAPVILEIHALTQKKFSLASATYWTSRLLAIGVFFLMLTPQFLQWREVYGSWITIPQGADFLSFPPQHLGQVLLSSQHGWFVWTPIAMLGMLGLVKFSTRVPALGLAILAACMAEIALISAVSTWHGHLFGMRYLTSLVPFLGIGLMALWLGRTTMTKMLLGGAFVACALFTLLFAAQYRLDLIPANDRLTFNELITDKADLMRHARARQRAVLEAQEYMDQGKADVAWQTSEQAASAHGDNQALIEIALQASATSGAKDDKHQSLALRRQRLEAKLLY